MNVEKNQSEQKFRKLFMEAPFGVAVINTRTRQICEANPEFARIINRSPDELLEVDWKEITHHDDVQKNLDYAQQMNAGVIDRFEMEKRYLCKDGSAVWIDMTVARLTDSVDEQPRHLCMIQDITERKQIEEQREKYLTLIDETLELTGDGILLVDNSGRVARCNKKFAEMADPAEFLAKNREFPGNPQAIASDLIHFADERVFERHTRPQIVDGDVVGRVWVLRDVTERQAKDELLRINVNRFNQLAEHDKSYSWEMNNEGLITYISGSCAAVLGYTPDEITGKVHFYELLVSGENSRTVKAAIFEKMIGSEAFTDIESAVNAKDGRIIWLKKAGLPVIDETGQVTGFSGSATDISRRKRTENELLFNSAVGANITQGVYLIGWDDLLIKWTNRPFEKMFGYEPGELIGKKVDIVNATTNKTPAETRRDIVEILSATGEWQGEVENITKTGTVLNCFANVSMFEHHQFGRVIMAVHTDITARKSAEAELRRHRDRLQREVLRANELAVRAEAANIAKNSFVANVSHEIRTPMNGILGFVHLLENTDITPEQADIIQTIKESTASLLNVINDILDFSKIEAGKIDVEHVPFDLRAVVQRALVPFLGRAEEKQLKINMLVHTDVPRFVGGDPARLRQVLVNLLGNAVKFTHFGEIFVEAALVEKASEGCKVRFAVRDSGIGIAAEALTQLFQPFQQADSSTSRKYGGTGLGLVISKSLVEAMQGVFEVQSIEGEGSVFAFVLPLDIAAEPSELRQPEHPAARCPKIEVDASDPKILLVEDNEINRRFMTKLLETKKMRCDIAVDGREAVRATQNKDYDLIFMDCQMPVLDGYTATRRIRELEAGRRHTPIVAMTAFAMTGDAERCLAAGMDEYISKPVEVQELLRIIRKYSDSDGSTDSNYADALQQLTKNSGFTAAEAKELLDESLPLIKANFAAIEAQLGFGQTEEALSLLHQLKGSSSNLWLTEIAAKAKAAERAVSDNNFGKLERLLGEIGGLIRKLG